MQTWPAYCPTSESVYNAARADITVDELLQVAEMQLAWRENWMSRQVTRYDDGRLSLGPRNGMLLLPACGEAAKLVWLMNLAINDVSASVALTMAGIDRQHNPFIDSLYAYADRFHSLMDRIQRRQYDERRNRTPMDHLHRRPARRAKPAAAALAAPMFFKNHRTRRSRFSPLKSAASYHGANELWQSLPDCADAVELALDFSQLASDRLSRIAYRVGGGAKMTLNPFDDAIEVGEYNSARLRIMAYRSVQPSGRDRSNCEIVPRRNSTPWRLPSPNMTCCAKAMTNLHNMRDFVDAADALLVWRDSLFSTMPACKASFEMGRVDEPYRR